MKKSKLFGTLLTLTLLGSTTIYAGSTYSSYNTTVGKLNGNGYTGFQTKSVSGANGNLKSVSVGGKYVVDARMQERNGTVGAWVRNISDDTNYGLPGNSSHLKGDSVRVQFSNDWNTPVNVQVTGSWRSN